MTKEKNQVVKEVIEVVEKIKAVLIKDSTTEGLNKELTDAINNLISDYNSTIECYLACNSLVMKYEKFMEVIGMIESASVLNPNILDESIKKLSTITVDIKQK